MDYYESSSYAQWCERVYGKDLKQTGMVTDKELELFYNEIKLSPESLILDVGCGLGYLTASISSHYNSDIIGIDIDEKSIILAKKQFEKNPRTDFHIMNANYLDFENSSFDLIYFFDTIYFVDTLQMLYSILNKCSDLLNPNGKLALFCSDNPQLNINNNYLDYHYEIKKWSNDNNKLYKTIDLTNEYRHFWPNAYKESLSMKYEFYSEVPDAYEKLLAKCSYFSELCLRGNDGGMFRYLDIIGK